MRGASFTAVTKRSRRVARSRHSPVPGAIAGWKLALEAASACGGRMRLCDLLAPAIARAKAGAMVTRGQARLTSETLAELEHRLRAAGPDVRGQPHACAEVMVHA